MSITPITSNQHPVLPTHLAPQHTGEDTRSIISGDLTKASNISSIDESWGNLDTPPLIERQLDDLTHDLATDTDLAALADKKNPNHAAAKAQRKDVMVRGFEAAQGLMGIEKYSPLISFDKDKYIDARIAKRIRDSNSVIFKNVSDAEQMTAADCARLVARNTTSENTQENQQQTEDTSLETAIKKILTDNTPRLLHLRGVARKIVSAVRNFFARIAQGLGLGKSEEYKTLIKHLDTLSLKFANAANFGEGDLINAINAVLSQDQCALANIFYRNASIRREGDWVPSEAKELKELSEAVDEFVQFVNKQLAGSELKEDKKNQVVDLLGKIAQAKGLLLKKSLYIGTRSDLSNLINARANLVFADLARREQEALELTRQAEVLIETWNSSESRSLEEGWFQAFHKILEQSEKIKSNATRQALDPIIEQLTQKKSALEKQLQEQEISEESISGRLSALYHEFHRQSDAAADLGSISMRENLRSIEGARIRDEIEQGREENTAKLKQIETDLMEMWKKIQNASGAAAIRQQIANIDLALEGNSPVEIRSTEISAEIRNEVFSLYEAVSRLTMPYNDQSTAADVKEYQPHILPPALSSKGMEPYTDGDSTSDSIVSSTAPLLLSKHGKENSITPPPPPPTPPPANVVPKNTSANEPTTQEPKNIKEAVQALEINEIKNLQQLFQPLQDQLSAALQTKEQETSLIDVLDRVMDSFSTENNKASFILNKVKEQINGTAIQDFGTGFKNNASVDTRAAYMKLVFDHFEAMNADLQKVLQERYQNITNTVHNSTSLQTTDNGTVVQVNKYDVLVQQHAKTLEAQQKLVSALENNINIVKNPLNQDNTGLGYQKTPSIQHLSNSMSSVDNTLIKTAIDNAANQKKATNDALQTSLFVEFMQLKQALENKINGS